MELRDSKWWDRQFEMGLPDSRLSGSNRDNKTFIRARQLWEWVFCASCGIKGGAVTAGNMAHTFFVCEKCAIKYNGKPPPGTIEVKPDGVNVQTKEI